MFVFFHLHQNSVWGKESASGIFRCQNGLSRCVPQIGWLHVNSFWSFHVSSEGKLRKDHFLKLKVLQFECDWCVNILSGLISHSENLSNVLLWVFCVRFPILTCPRSWPARSHALLCMSSSSDRAGLVSVNGKCSWKWKDNEDGQERNATAHLGLSSLDFNDGKFFITMGW